MTEAVKTKPDNIEFKCSGSPVLSIYMGVTTYIVLFVMGLGFIFIGNKASIITGALISLLCVYSFGRIIKFVIFSEDGILVRYNLKKSRKFEYKNCKTFYRTTDGMIHDDINVLIIDENHRKVKITFACEQETLRKICDTHFNGFQPKVM